MKCMQVLDIGHYKQINVRWEVHNVEQEGTWHTTVGEYEH